MHAGAGLPVASGPEIGDLDELLGPRRVSVVFDSFSEDGYERCLREIRDLARLGPCSRRTCLVYAAILGQVGGEDRDAARSPASPQ